MKLVDILAREITEWPQGQPCLWISDAHSATIYGKSGSFEVSFNGDWRCPEDYLDAIVYKAEWQAAVDKLNAEKAVEWDGEGLPPVGTVCEAKTTRGWSRGTIIAHGLPPKENIAVWQEDGERISLGVKEYFRQIRTPEQIAAEERDKAIEGMIADTNILTGIMSDRRIMAGQIYDAGYRKFKIVDN